MAKGKKDNSGKGKDKEGAPVKKGEKPKDDDNFLFDWFFIWN